MLISYAYAMCRMPKNRDHGQLWMVMLLLLLVALNDPLYIARVLVGGKLPFERFRAKLCCTQRVPPCDGCPWDVLLRLMSPRSSPPGAPAKLLLQLRSNYLDRYVSRPASADRICRCER